MSDRATSAGLHEAAWPDLFASLQAAYAELAESQFELERRTADIDEARELFEQVIDSMSEALFLLDTQGRILRVNNAAVGLLGIDRDQVVGTPLSAIWPDDRIPTTPRELVDRAPDGALSDLDVEIEPRHGRPVAASVSCALVRNEAGRITGLLVVARDITERKHAEAALSFLAEASRSLAESLEYETTLVRVADIAVRRLADWCIIDVVDDDGSIRRAAVAHADADKAPLAETIREASELDPAATSGVPHVIRARRSEVHRRPDAALLAAGVRRPEPLQEFVRDVRPAAWMCVPLGRGRTRGAISFLSTDPARRYDAVDVAVAEELARRAAVALDNARLFELERDVAETLQRSLLPQRLPTIPEASIAARYLPAHATAVGGDWYDVMELPRGEIGLVMGDVAGRGVTAAAIMGRLRSALKAYAYEGHPPAAAAARLNALLEDFEMATMAYVIVDTVAGTLRYVNAAHPPPLVVAADGRTRFLEGGSPPLFGMLATYREYESSLEPGDTLLLYTDGLVEVRGEIIDEGLARLEREAARTAGRPLGEILDRLVDRVPSKRHRMDDVALLAMRLDPVDRQPLHLRLEAAPESLQRVRRVMRRWLTAFGVDAVELHDIVVATGEACSNAIEHAYGPGGGDLALDAAVDDGELVVTVRDSGSWRAARGRHRGRGTGLMEGLMDEVSVERGSGGTTVVMRRRLAGDFPA